MDPEIHYCPYCGHVTIGTTDDVLCPICAMGLCRPPHPYADTAIAMSGVELPEEDPEEGEGEGE